MMKNPTIIVLFILTCTLLTLCFVAAASAQSTLVKAEVSTTQPRVGDTLTVNIKLSDAQNVYGLDVTLDWNSAVLQLISATPQLGVESHSGGVLHESNSYPIEVVDNNASQDTGEFHLAATSTGASTPAFSGSGTIATVTFNVTSTGSAGLTLEDVGLSEPAGDGTYNLVTPQVSVDSATAIGPQATASSTASVPEFQTQTIVLAALVIDAAIALSVTLLRKRQTNP
jgi:hypothetical protein